MKRSIAVLAASLSLLGGSAAFAQEARWSRMFVGGIGMAVAEWCAKQDAITKVHYPGLPGHPDHELATKTLAGFGGMLGIELKGGVRAAERFLKSLTIAAHAPSLGGVETLVSEPRLTSHASLTAEQRAQAGIPDGFLRFSLGLEDPDDLIADFAQALARH